MGDKSGDLVGRVSQLYCSKDRYQLLKAIFKKNNYRFFETTIINNIKLLNFVTHDIFDREFGLNSKFPF